MKVGLKWDDEGLIPAVVQDAETGDVLTLAYMNSAALEATVKTGETHFWSRSRGELWHKGAKSGNIQKVVSLAADCDADALLVRVIPAGPACHTGAEGCFFQTLHGAGAHVGRTIARLYRLIEDRKREMPEDSYTVRLFQKGLDSILKKIGEESTETVVAAKGGKREEIVWESADLIYHLLVLLVEKGIRLEEIQEELERRRKNVTSDE